MAPRQRLVTQPSQEDDQPIQSVEPEKLVQDVFQKSAGDLAKEAHDVFNLVALVRWLEIDQTFTTVT